VRRLRAGPAWELYSVDLRELAASARTRPLRLDDLYSLQVIIPHPREPVRLQIDNVRLR
jgi:hypothetical protein